MRVKSQKDFWSGLMFVVMGLGFAWGATEYSFGSSARPGPGYFPFGLGILLAVLGSVVLFKALTIESDSGDRIGAIAWKPLLVIVSAVALFGLLLPRLGLVCTLPVLVTVAALAGDEFKLRDALINSVLLTVLSWVVFIWGLGLVIPTWPPFLSMSA